MTARIALTAEVDEWRNARDPDCDIDQSFAPDATKCVRYDDPTSENPSQLASRTIRIPRKKTHCIRAFNVRLIDPGIGTNEAVMRFADENVAPRPNNSPRFAEDDLNQSRIFLHPSSNYHTLRRRLHRREMNDPSFRLRNDFLCDRDDVLRLKIDAALVHRIQQALRQIRIGMYLRHMLDGYELELHCTCWRYRHVSLSLRGSARNACISSGVSMSNAMPGRSITSERIPAAVAFERCRRKLPSPYSIAIRAGGIKSTPLVPVQSRDGMKVIGSEAALNAKSISEGTSLGKSAAIERIREEVADSSSTIWFTAAL